MSENENFHDALREGINEVLNAELPIIPTYEDEKAVTMPTYKRNSIEVNLNKLHEFTNHPFKVIDDKDMDKLKASIKHDGILTPIIIRSTAEGEYEIISGHRRKKACELLTIPTIPAEIIECDDDEAIIMMVSSNLQRAKNHFYEIVKACNMMYDAMLRKEKVSEEEVKEKIAGIAGIKYDTLQSFIDMRTKHAVVLDDVLEFADKGRLPKSLITIAELRQETLQAICSFLQDKKNKKVRISLKHIKEIHKKESETPISEDILREITNRKPYIIIKLKDSDIREYLPSNVRMDKLDDFVVQLLKYWSQQKSRTSNENNQMLPNG